MEAEEPLLYSLQGYLYCDLLLSRGRPPRRATGRRKP